MRKLLVCIFFVFFHNLIFHTVGYGQNTYLQQRVSISVNDTALDAVLADLSKQCECYFSYNANVVNGNVRFSLNLRDKSLAEVLDSVFEPSFSFEEFKNQIIIFRNDEHKIQQPINAPEHVIIHGVVVDSITSLPIPYASVAIVGAFIGTVCNENGAFSLKIPNDLKNALISVSSMGYNNHTFVPLLSEHTIKLQSGVISIQEVLVRSIGPSSLLRNARKHFKENYRVEPYSYTSFYRESTRKNEKYLTYTEAFLKGKKFGLNSDRDDKMTLVKSRNFRNIDPVDTLLVKLQGGIDACIRLDLIRNQPDFIANNSEDIYDYQLRDVKVWEDKLVHVLSFQPKKNALDAVFEGDIFIGVDDLAIIGADFGYSPHRMNGVKKNLVLRKSNKIKAKPVSTRYELKYSNYGGKYYIQHIRGELDLKAKRKKQVRFSNFHTSLEMVVTNIDTLNTTNPSKRDLMKTHSIFSDQVEITSNNFWINDNIILPESNIIKAFKQSGFKLEEKK